MTSILRQGFEMAQELFSIYMDGVVGEVDERTQRRKVNIFDRDHSECVLSELLFAEDAAVL